MSTLSPSTRPPAWDTVVLGGGPAGLSAALMLGRARRRVLVLDSSEPRNASAEHVHGVVGLERIGPEELLARGRLEISRYGVAVHGARVSAVVDDDDRAAPLTIRADAAAHRARSLVLATGLRDELANVPGLRQRWGHSVLHCPYCHGWEVRDQRLAVLLASPAGLHQAELLRQWTDRLTVLTHAVDLDDATERRLRSRDIAVERVPVSEVLGEGRTTRAVRLADGRELALDAIFTTSVPRPLDDAVADLGRERTETPFGSFLAVDATGRTSQPRIWAVGNVVEPRANVPFAMGAGTLTGAAVNAALVTAEFDDAESHHS